MIEILLRHQDIFGDLFKNIVTLTSTKTEGENIWIQFQPIF